VDVRKLALTFDFMLIKHVRRENSLVIDTYKIMLLCMCRPLPTSNASSWSQCFALHFFSGSPTYDSLKQI
jgi:hypothetical protein